MTANLKGKEFRQVLQAQFPKMHGARRKFLEKMIPALVKASSVELRRIASAFGTSAQEDSVVLQIQRFISQEILEAESQARLIIALLGIEGPMTGYFGHLGSSSILVKATQRGIKFVCEGV